MWKVFCLQWGAKKWEAKAAVQKLKPYLVVHLIIVHLETHHQSYEFNGVFPITY